MDLLKGSLQTFLNAFTYPDRTCESTRFLLYTLCAWH